MGDAKEEVGVGWRQAWGCVCITSISAFKIWTSELLVVFLNPMGKLVKSGILVENMHSKTVVNFRTEVRTSIVKSCILIKLLLACCHQIISPFSVQLATISLAALMPRGLLYQKLNFHVSFNH